MKPLHALALVAAALLSGCDRGGPRDLGFAAACDRDGQCSSGLCVSASAGAAEGRCTRSCATDADCPRGHSCSGATNSGVVVCMPGPAVPIGGPGQEP